MCQKTMKWSALVRSEIEYLTSTKKISEIKKYKYP
jgi:hypothetical protein